MSKQHKNIPIFIPHLGCPNQCVFCNQRTISGVTDFSVSLVEPQIKEALATVDKENTYVEIAFFGGSFTGIEYSLMCELLSIAYKYVSLGLVDSIRLSTRPDYIDDNILSTLKRYGVKTIELGLQSLRDNVLRASKRGHTADIALLAGKKILEYGFELVGQMMIGLPESTLDDEIYTARSIVQMGAQGARIYPTVVLQDTELKDFCLCDSYSPLLLEDAVMRSKEVIKIFLANGVDVIRVGLHASENLVSPQTYYAGPNHPALGELVYGELYFDLIDDLIRSGNSLDLNREIILLAPLGASSKVIGQKKKNIIRLKEKYKFKSIIVREDPSLNEYQIKIIDRTEYLCT